MKNQIVKSVLLTLGFSLGAFLLWAQAQKKIEFKGNTFLSDKVTQSGSISVSNFLKLIQDTIWVQDNRDNSFLAPGSFKFSYAERGVYEDEAGKPMIVTDYIFSNCRAVVDSGMLVDMKYRAKPGDTAYFEQVLFLNLKQKDKTSVHAAPIKLVLTK